MIITCISDTHGHHHSITNNLKGGDLLIHAGDVTEYGTKAELDDFISWFSKLNYTHKIFIGGNHDFILEDLAFKQNLGHGVIYLQNNAVTINDYKIWGSPVSPYFLGMAFNEKRGEPIAKVWNKIPPHTDILITHTPPYGVLDDKLGCLDLKQTIDEIKPKYHIFGHIHGSYGVLEDNGTTFINASIVNTKDIMDLNYKVVNKPITIDLS